MLADATARDLSHNLSHSELSHSELSHSEVAMAAYWLWWIAAAALVGVELLTGTVYLLAVGVAAVIGGVAAWFGWGAAAQFLAAGAAGSVLVWLARRRRMGRVTSAPQVSLDVGALVRVEQWRGDGTLRVAHRGAGWEGELARPDIPRSESLYVVATRGSVLVLSDQRP